MTALDISKFQHDILLYHKGSASTFLFLCFILYAIRSLFTLLKKLSKLELFSDEIA